MEFEVLSLFNPQESLKCFQVRQPSKQGQLLLLTLLQLPQGEGLTSVSSCRLSLRNHIGKRPQGTFGPIVSNSTTAKSEMPRKEVY